jgi:hypothetical protein
MGGLCLLSSAGLNAAAPLKVDICHAPPDNPINIQYIQVGSKGGAVSDHLAHGDWLVTEERCDAIPDNDCDGAPDPEADDADCVAQLGMYASCMDGVCVPPSGDTPIGTITESILRGGTPPGSDRGVESAAGNLVADTHLFATAANGAEIAFMNPGGVRSDLLYPESAGEGDGVVTYGEAFAFSPFGNTLRTFPMSGAQIVSVLEEQCQPAGVSRPFLHLGVSDGFTYDLAKTEVGGICTSVSITNVRLNGVPLEPAGSYLVTANNFLADGGDNFGTFTLIDPATWIIDGIDLQALLAYFAAYSPVAPPSTDRVNEL